MKPRDTFSNPSSASYTDPSQAGFVVEVTGPDGALQASWDVAAAKIGELATTFLPVQTGSCSIAVKYRGQHVQSSPYQVVSVWTVTTIAVLVSALYIKQ